MSSSVSSKQVLKLYKHMLEKACKFDNYNFREYSKRRIRYGFKESKNESDPEKILTLYNSAVNDLGMLERQTAISQMFTFEKLVVEPLKRHAHRA